MRLVAVYYYSDEKPWRQVGEKTETEEFAEFTKTPAWAKIKAELAAKGIYCGFGPPMAKALR